MAHRQRSCENKSRWREVARAIGPALQILRGKEHVPLPRGGRAKRDFWFERKCTLPVSASLLEEEPTKRPPQQ
jgi:hypothetical protein